MNNKINNFDRYLVLEAGAGSGKTFALVSRYLHLLFLDVDPSKIVAITFTRKATKEMYDRIISSLKDPDHSQEILTIQNMLSISRDETVQKSADYLHKFLNSDVKIKTIDSFSHSIFKKFAHYLDIVPNFKLTEKFQQDAFCEVFLNSLSNNKLLWIDFLDAKEYSGLGKTFKYELCNTMNEFYIKEIQLKDKFDVLRKLELNKDFLQEINNEILQNAFIIKNKFLNENNLSDSGKKALDFKNIDQLAEKGKTWLIKDHLADFSYFKKYKLICDDLHHVFTKLKALISKKIDNENLFLLSKFIKIYDLYLSKREEFIKRESKFTFSDIDHFIAKLLIFDEQIDSHFIYFRLDEKIDHFLIDEFQDTSLLQYKILEPLIDEILSGEGINNQFGKSFFYVGDKNQSLYRFRGGFMHLFDHVHSNNSVIKSSKLDKNFRSKSNIVNFVNTVFQTEQNIGLDSQIGGSVIIKNSFQENIIFDAVENVKSLLMSGIFPHEIAVICSKNEEVELISNLFTENKIPHQTEINKRLHEYRTNIAIIEYIKYLYFRQRIYLKTFWATLGKSPEEEHEFFDIDLFDNSVYAIAVKIVQKFRLYDGDNNLLEFLDLIRTNFHDIEEFIFNYQDLETKAKRNINNGITVITIHKSKGLQFKNVVFLDFLDKQKDNNRLVLSYKGLNVDKLFWKSSSDFISIQNQDYYSELKSYEETAKITDMKNKLYVGMTRAKDNLIILKIDQRNSATKLLEPNINNFELTDNLFDKYDPNNFDPEILNLFKHDEPFYFDFEDSDDLYKPQYDYQETTEEELRNKLDSYDIFNDEVVFSRAIETYKIITLGTALHLTIELMNSFDLESLEIAIKVTKNRFGHILNDRDLFSIKRRILALISHSFFKDLIKSGTIKKETGYIRENGETRYIDLLIEYENEIIIFDFKSSDNNLLKEKYYKQVREYMTDFYKLIGKKTNGYLVYLKESGTVFENILLK